MLINNCRKEKQFGKRIKHGAIMLNAWSTLTAQKVGVVEVGRE
jgi:acyl dehydratase